MGKWMTDEEIEELTRKRELTGNDFVDAYQLGYDAARRGAAKEIADAQAKRFEADGRRIKAEDAKEAVEARCAELEAKAAKLRRKLKRLKKGAR